MELRQGFAAFGLEEPVSNGFEAQRVCVLGLGYVGLPLAVELAKRHKVTGFDVDAPKVEELKRGHDRMREVTTEELQSVKVEYTTDPARMKDAEYIIVAVPTPITSTTIPTCFWSRKPAAWWAGTWRVVPSWCSSR